MHPLVGRARGRSRQRPIAAKAAPTDVDATAGLPACVHTADNGRLTHTRSPSEYSEPSAMTIVRMTDLDLSGKRVLIRQGEPV
ncbi:hypothetical protein LDO31_18190 [Luteimonas sp. XNQY3]|nr:hypothetical protein [Luteimonas sp. XNQY3]MCD9008129.1 hypothetical protein [Luteimonas sp. XNQY3]